jgi:hypothetical protein
VFIERKAAALRAASVLKDEAAESKNDQSQHDYRNQQPSAIVIASSAVCGLVSAEPVVLRLSQPGQGSALARQHCAATESLSRRVEQWKWRSIRQPECAKRPWFLTSFSVFDQGRLHLVHTVHNEPCTASRFYAAAAAVSG